MVCIGQAWLIKNFINIRWTYEISYIWSFLTHRNGYFIWFSIEEDNDDKLLMNRSARLHKYFVKTTKEFSFDACFNWALFFSNGSQEAGFSHCSCCDTRTVLCNDQDMNELPLNFPVDTVKLRIEKTVIRKIPAEAFYYLVELQYLWVTYNSIFSLEASSFYNLGQLHELRLDGNSLAAFPWASLLYMPHLRILDLHNNQITSVPNGAARYLKNLIYLDLSSNRLTTLPPEFLESWSPVLTTLFRSRKLSPRIILGKLTSLSALLRSR